MFCNFNFGQIGILQIIQRWLGQCSPVQLIINAVEAPLSADRYQSPLVSAVEIHRLVFWSSHRSNCNIPDVKVAVNSSFFN